jgi:hypothetical protein
MLCRTISTLSCDIAHAVSRHELVKARRARAQRPLRDAF